MKVSVQPPNTSAGGVGIPCAISKNHRHREEPCSCCCPGGWISGTRLSKKGQLLLKRSEPAVRLFQGRAASTAILARNGASQAHRQPRDWTGAGKDVDIGGSDCVEGGVCRLMFRTASTPTRETGVGWHGSCYAMIKVFCVDGFDSGVGGSWLLGSV